MDRLSLVLSNSLHIDHRFARPLHCPLHLIADCLLPPSSLYSPADNSFRNPRSGAQKQSLHQLLEAGLIHPFSTAVFDFNLWRALPLPSAIAIGLIDSTGRVFHTRDQRFIHLDEAARCGALISLSSPAPIMNLLAAGLYSPQHHLLRLPLEEETVSFAAALDLGELVDPTSAGVLLRDGAERRLVSLRTLREAGGFSDSGLLWVGGGEWCSLAETHRQGLLRSLRPPLALYDALLLGDFNRDTGLLSFSGREMTLHEAIQANLILASDHVFVTQDLPRKSLSLVSAIHSGALNASWAVSEFAATRESREKWT